MGGCRREVEAGGFDWAGAGRDERDTAASCAGLPRDVQECRSPGRSLAETAVWPLGWRVLHPFWNRGISFTDCLCQCRQSSDGSRRWTAKRDGCARGDGRKQKNTDPTSAHRERFAFADRGTGRSAPFFSQRQNLQHVGSILVSAPNQRPAGWQGSAVYIRHLCSDRDRLWSDPRLSRCENEPE